jgi:hypothetical protein
MGLPDGPTDLAGGTMGLPDGPTDLAGGPTGLPDGPTGLPDGPMGLPDRLTRFLARPGTGACRAALGFRPDAPDQPAAGYRAGLAQRGDLAGGLTRQAWACARRPDEGCLGRAPVLMGGAPPGWPAHGHR